MKILKGLLMIITAPVILVLTLFVWLCTGLIYISGLVLGLLSTVIALLGVAVLITYSPQNGVILLVKGKWKLCFVNLFIGIVGFHAFLRYKYDIHIQI